MVIDELIAILGFDVQGETNLKKFNSMLDQAEQKSQAFARAVGNVALVAGGAIVTSLSALTAGVVSTGAQFEQLGVRLEALEGSAEKGKQALEWVRKFAEETPLSLSESADAYAKLRTFGIDPTNGSLLAAVDTMAMAGQGADYLNGIVLAMGQAWTKQKLQGEEALQLIERGVPVWDLLSESMGVSVEQVQELSKKGKLGRKEMQLLFDAMGKRALGASEKMAKTWTGLIGRLGDKWEGFLKLIADGGVFDEVKSVLEGVMDTLETWSKDGSMQRVADKLGSAMKVGIGWLKIFAERVQTHVKFISDNFKKLEGYINALGTAMLLLVAYSRPVTTAIIIAGLAVDDLMTYLEGGDSVIGRFIEKIKELTGVSEGVAARLAAIGGVITAVLLPTILRAIPRVGGALVFGLLRALTGPVGWGLIAAELVASLMGINLFELGARLVNSFIDGMRSIIPSLKDAITGAFTFGSGPSADQLAAAKARGSSADQWLADNGPAWLNNMIGNTSRMSPENAAAAAGTVNDSRDQSQTVNVNVGGVTVNGAQNVTTAAGAAVGNAVGKAAAGAVSGTPSRIVNPGSSF